MITLTEYLNNPCGTLSIPYWKAKNIVIPPEMKILHDKEFRENILLDYIDEKYFRLYHNLKEIPRVITNDFEITTATRKDIKAIVQIINDSYYGYICKQRPYQKLYQNTCLQCRTLGYGQGKSIKRICWLWHS